MKNLLLLLALIPALLFGQIPGEPDASGTITPGPPDFVTGAAPGDGELKLQLQYIQSVLDSIKAVFNYENSTIGPLSTNLTISADYPGLLGTFITNTHDGAVEVAGAVHQVTNNEGYWGLLGMTNSGSTILGGIFANTLHIYNQGYANTLFTVDGNADFVWYSDPLDGHDFSALNNEIMRLTASGELQFGNGASIDNTETDTLFIEEAVTKITGELLVTGHITAGEHASGLTYISTGGTQSIGTGGTFERLNEGTIAYTGEHLHEFTHDDGRLTYTTDAEISMTIAASVSVESGEVTQEVQLRIAKNGTTIAGTNMQVEFTAVNGNASVSLFWMLDMDQNDYIEVWGTSDTSGDDVIINNLTMGITKH